MPTRRQRHLLLRKPLDPVSDNINTSLVTGVELENSFLVCISEQGPRETED